MTLGEFRKATAEMSDDLILVEDSTGNPVWYVIEIPTGDGASLLRLMDKSGIDLCAEILASYESLDDKYVWCNYMKSNGVTLDEIKHASEELYNVAKKYY